MKSNRICTTCGGKLNRKDSCEPCTVLAHTPRQTNGIVTNPTGARRDQEGWGY